MGHDTYLFWLCAFLWLPTGLLWLTTNGRLMARYWRLPLLIAVQAVILGLPWDYTAVRLHI